MLSFYAVFINVQVSQCLLAVCRINLIKETNINKQQTENTKENNNNKKTDIIIHVCYKAEAFATHLITLIVCEFKSEESFKTDWTKAEILKAVT